MVMAGSRYLGPSLPALIFVCCLTGYVNLDTMGTRNLRVHDKRDGDLYTVLLDSRLRDETLMFESGAVAELSELHC